MWQLRGTSTYNNSVKVRSPCEKRGQMNISPDSDTFNLSCNYYPKIIISDNRTVCFSLWLVLATGFPLPTSPSGLTRISHSSNFLWERIPIRSMSGSVEQMCSFFSIKWKNFFKKSAFKCTNLSTKLILTIFVFHIFYIISRINPPRDTECFWKITVICIKNGIEYWRENIKRIKKKKKGGMVKPSTTILLGKNLHLRLYFYKIWPKILYVSISMWYSYV